jgi:hypothetical protein
MIEHIVWMQIIFIIFISFFQIALKIDKAEIKQTKVFQRNWQKIERQYGN